jgi:hypothetical protein
LRLSQIVAPSRGSTFFPLWLAAVWDFRVMTVQKKAAQAFLSYLFFTAPASQVRVATRAATALTNQHFEKLSRA